MNDTEKLTALLQRAIDNGADLKLTPLSIPDYAKLCLKSPWQEQLLFGGKDFAKGLFGDGPNCAYCNEPPHHTHPSPCVEGNNTWPYLWEYHLQKAVISSNPVDYLYKAVFNDN